MRRFNLSFDNLKIIANIFFLDHLTMTLRRTLFGITALFFSFSLQSQASEGTWGEENVKLSDLEVEVVLSDDARDGCWTNLREVREYAEEKLFSRGIKRVKSFDYQNPNHYRFNISVVAARIYNDNSGPCAGHISLDLVRYAPVNGWFHIVTLYDGKDSLFLDKANLNNKVLEQVRLKINDMP